MVVSDNNHSDLCALVRVNSGSVEEMPRHNEVARTRNIGNN